MSKSIVSRGGVWRALGASMLCVFMASTPGFAQHQSQDLPADATLARLIEQTLAALPELDSREHIARAQAARTAQAGAWPDPILQLGIQNDGFKSIQIGMMETSFVSLMASQTIPWPGKTRLRESISELEANDARASVARMRLSAEAFVRRGYLDLMWVRERRALLEHRLTLGQHALEAALARYQAGTGAQVDALRAKLELTRLEQQRSVLDVEERLDLQALNRARQRPSDEAIVTARGVRELSVRAERIRAFSPEHAVATSPELAAARAQVTRAGEQRQLAQKSYSPDLTLGAGFMYRGSLPPMWLMTVAAPVPVFGASKQGGAVRESRALEQAAHEQLRALEQLVRLRSLERRELFTALTRTVALYEQGLLAQSATTAEAMLTQYRVGKGTFASVLEANAGLIGDEESYLRALVDAERLLIAEREVSLQSSPLPSLAASGSAMPGAMSATAVSAPVAPTSPSSGVGASSPTPTGGNSGGSMSGMGVRPLP